VVVNSFEPNRTLGRAGLLAAPLWMVVCTLAVAATPARGQDAARPLFSDPGAARLHEAAVAYHLAHADRLHAYEAVVRQRVAAKLRTPLRDRTLYRSEAVHTVSWTREGPVEIHALGVREQTPAGVEDEIDLDLVDHFYDPASDRLLIGRRTRRARSAEDAADDGSAAVVDASEPLGAQDLPDEEETRRGTGFQIEHPLEEASAAGYVFASGDTLTVLLPDGSSVSAVELVVTPRVRAPERISGVLWIEPRSGALVRAVYRMSSPLDAARDVQEVREADRRGEYRWIPGLFKPWVFDVSVVTVDYALWEGDVWLPRRWRGEGRVTAGILDVPAEFDRSYRFTRVETSADESGTHKGGQDTDESGDAGAGTLRTVRREVGGREVLVTFPRDVGSLRTSGELPPPIWEDAPGFISGAELEGWARALDALPPGGRGATPRWFRWGFSRPDLVRFNRVEALSVGARGAVLPDVLGRPLSVTGTVRVGVADVHPNARVDVERTTVRGRWLGSAYHELAATEEGARHLGLGNSLTALFAGRDDGDYYRRSGVALTFGPPPRRRSTWAVTLSSEHHAAAPVETRFSLVRLWRDDAWRFRPALAVDEGWEHAVSARWSPAWGTDPARARVWLDATGTGAWGDLDHVRGALEVGSALPLPADFRLGLAVGGGAGTRDLPPQRAFAVGGAGTLRGYDPRSMVGACQTRGRVELQRGFAAGSLSGFFDQGWAGSCDVWPDGAGLRSAGIGLSLVDGVIRADLARALDGARGFRFHLYLDGMF